MVNDNHYIPRLATTLCCLLTFITCNPYPSMTMIDHDTYGVPHISGATEADAAFGFGYAQAQDHLGLMLRNYMEATGRLAEIDGEDAIETDARTRLWRTAERAAAAYPQLDPSTRTYLDAFVAGINQYMETHPGDVPTWAHRESSIQIQDARYMQH